MTESWMHCQGVIFSILCLLCNVLRWPGHGFPPSIVFTGITLCHDNHAFVRMGQESKIVCQINQHTGARQCDMLKFLKMLCLFQQGNFASDNVLNVWTFARVLFFQLKYPWRSMVNIAILIGMAPSPMGNNDATALNAHETHQFQPHQDLELNLLHTYCPLTNQL
jgi:hypothetical protein